MVKSERRRTVKHSVLIFVEQCRNKFFKLLILEIIYERVNFVHHIIRIIIRARHKVVHIYAVRIPNGSRTLYFHLRSTVIRREYAPYFYNSVSFGQERALSVVPNLRVYLARLVRKRKVKINGTVFCTFFVARLDECEALDRTVFVQLFKIHDLSSLFFFLNIINLLNT